MRRLRAAAPILALLVLAPALSAEPSSAPRRGAIVRKGVAQTSYSVEVPVVTRIQGTAFFRTAIDISNNTNDNGVTATFQYSYRRTSDNGFFRTTPHTLTLDAVFNFHQDDFVQYMGSLGLLQPGAADSSFGTLLVTFENLPSIQGWEGTVTARTYSPAPGGGTNGIAYAGTLFFESASSTLVATIRDTLPSPTEAGALRTNLGIRNTDINGTTNAVIVDISFYDVVTGTRVGDILSRSLQPGEVHQISNVFAVAAIPSSVVSVIAFADVRNPTSTSPTIEGYVNILDDATKDGSFFEMKCADTDPCGN
jgi:hypothetical protein